MRYGGLVIAALALLAGIGEPALAASAAHCGDRDTNGSVTASDALGVLKVSVGSASCALCICDVNGNGSISASDALAVLKIAVGQALLLKCEGCDLACNESAAPACGGQCPGGLVCAVPPTDQNGQLCECLTACEAGEAPACAASCTGSFIPNAICGHVQLKSGNLTEDICLCLPPGVQSCGVSSAPQCGGVCQPAHVCTAHGSNCQCDAQPKPGPCGDAAAPQCAGVCPAGQLCEQSGQVCACISSDGGEQICRNAYDPVCGAPCNDGKGCTKDFLGGCGCFNECETSDATSCTGSCGVDGGQCKSITASVPGGSSVPYCICE